MCHNRGNAGSNLPGALKLTRWPGMMVAGSSLVQEIAPNLDIGEMDDAIPPGCDFRDDDKKPLERALI